MPVFKSQSFVGPLVGAIAVLMPAAAFAQPPAVIAPLPGVQTHGPHVHKERPAQVPAQDKLVTNFEQIFGRKLTDDQIAQMAKATDARTAAIKAAQDAWHAQFLTVTGLTEDEFREKQKAFKQQQIADREARQAAEAAGTTAPATTTTPTTGTAPAAAEATATTVTK